ncbi:TPA: lipase [Listeria monocytogenes]|nr:lipase [Listeria monocytogenes]
MTKKKWLWLTGSVLVIALLVGAVFGIKYYKESKEIPINLVAMGDSLTEGVGDENKDGGYVGIIPKKLEEEPNVPSVKTSNYGVSGNKITQLEKRLKANKEFQQELETLLKDIRSYNKDAAIFLMGIYNPYTTYFSDIKQFDEIISDWNKASKKTIQQDSNAYFVPIAKVLEDRNADNKDKPNSLLSDDYFHPNHKGYEKMTSELDKAIVKQLNEGNIPK